MKARAAQRKAGAYLADRVRVLEAEVENSKQTLATALASDPAESGSSTYSFVLASIGLGQSEGDAFLARRADMSGEDADDGASGGLKNNAHVGGLHEAMMRAEIFNRRASSWQ